MMNMTLIALAIGAELIPAADPVEPAPIVTDVVVSAVGLDLSTQEDRDALIDRVLAEARKVCGVHDAAATPCHVDVEVLDASPTPALRQIFRDYRAGR
ncbi:UrcA family protein [Sphingomicrobium arenosum]|uniref:UrcA family protein n=1 Tax=Sphingomicrobium arenosum TaxID=2233861 RepID=UPI002240C4DF|nr:UrcA family protein [Sphingomicrobium arenosum]